MQVLNCGFSGDPYFYREFAPIKRSGLNQSEIGCGKPVFHAFVAEAKASVRMFGA